MIVIDASVAVKWVVVEADHEAALRLAASSLEIAAPGIIVPELVNVLRKKVLRREIDGEQAREASAKALALVKRFVEVPSMRDEIMDLALRLNHAAYDCCYIANANRLGTSLITADRVLATKAREAGVEFFGLSDWPGADR